MRSSLKRSFLSRSWMTASLEPWMSESEVTRDVLLEKALLERSRGAALTHACYLRTPTALFSSSLLSLSRNVRGEGGADEERLRGTKVENSTRRASRGLSFLSAQHAAAATNDCLRTDSRVSLLIINSLLIVKNAPSSFSEPKVTSSYCCFAPTDG